MPDAHPFPPRRGPGALAWVETILLQTPLRLALGAVFILAAYLKLFHTSDAVADPVWSFAESIKAYQLIDPAKGEHLIIFLAYVIPWTELLAGVMLILGAGTRTAATLLTLMLVAFTAANLSVIARGIDTTCSCFGELEWPCKGAVSWCQFWRNCVLLAVSMYLAIRSGGLLALERLFARRAPRHARPVAEPGEYA